ncbi:uncharacterized protein TNCV_3810091 [Trichonephila clavipes]|nr:uncharacterized protein TNCV_3810091 [Trichonephila clavipes]
MRQNVYLGKNRVGNNCFNHAIQHPSSIPMASFGLIDQAYGDETLSRAHVSELHKRISGARDSVKDDERAGHPGCQVIYSQFGLAIHQNDHQARRRFLEWAQNEIAVVPDFHKRILFSDEAHFWLNDYVNKQNCRIWSEANPQVATITNFFIPELNNHDVQELWFQQDGATCHTARATIDLLKDTFGDHLISRFGPVNWPPRSCDLTPLDYFLWGYVKSLVYADKPQTPDHLEDNIHRVIADIRPHMLEKVIENWTSRLDYIRASRGSPMPEIIFKMYLSTGNLMASLSHLFRTGRSTTSAIIKETCEAISSSLKPIVLAKPDQNKWLDIAEAHYEQWQFPNCLGAINGIHVLMQTKQTFTYITRELTVTIELKGIGAHARTSLQFRSLAITEDCSSR